MIKPILSDSKSTPLHPHLNIVKDIQEPALHTQYRLRFLGRLHNKLYTISVKEVSYIVVEESTTLLITQNSKRIFIQLSLDQIEKQVHPKYYFRINRKVLLHINSIIELLVVSKSRIKVTLADKSQHLVSRAKNGEFKEWLDL
ncbi:LytTR family transcriptional regulator [Rasiella rasia]|uniref:LytTR family transcriptional regulator n=1 Tax=Rasiella rasia TaxID=2744027 RepID=A0A6G6GRH4_9FLAO|nr:LytTR family DNA-binding domain-containing protein [Rasiella rasia]QIE60311.1 LytTR family transcriptional regulator [Rasiella rasia]